MGKDGHQSLTSHRLQEKDARDGMADGDSDGAPLAQGPVWGEDPSDPTRARAAPAPDWLQVLFSRVHFWFAPQVGYRSCEMHHRGRLFCPSGRGVLCTPTRPSYNHGSLPSIPRAYRDSSTNTMPGRTSYPDCCRRCTRYCSGERLGLGKQSMGSHGAGYYSLLPLEPTTASSGPIRIFDRQPFVGC